MHTVRWTKTVCSCFLLLVLGRRGKTSQAFSLSQSFSQIDVYFPFNYRRCHPSETAETASRSQTAKGKKDGRHYNSLVCYIRATILFVCRCKAAKTPTGGDAEKDCTVSTGSQTQCVAHSSPYASPRWTGPGRYLQTTHEPNSILCSKRLG